MVSFTKYQPGTTSLPVTVAIPLEPVRYSPTSRPSEWLTRKTVSGMGSPVMASFLLMMRGCSGVFWSLITPFSASFSVNS